MPDNTTNCPNNYCAIPGGTFLMGMPSGPGYVNENQQPIKEVTLYPYELRKTEVTWGEYLAFVAKNASEKFQTILAGLNQRNLADENLPASGLNYEEMRAFCRSERADLPMAAQLEFASLGASGQDKFGTPIDAAIIKQNGYTSPQPPCGPNNERANSNGVCDLMGNLFETALDAYDPTFYARMPEINPYNPVTDLYDAKTNPDGQVPEVRGGFYGSGPLPWSPAKRGLVDSLIMRSPEALGFRCSRPLNANEVE